MSRNISNNQAGKVPRRLLIVDNFAGGGGASTGLEAATGQPVTHAINHNDVALGMHRINHPGTVHHCEDVFDVVPADLAEGRTVDLGWFSPDCRHHSKAKGGKPVDKRIRGLVLIMLKWAKYGVRVMFMENVEEIRCWGPLVLMHKNGHPGWYPDPAHTGRTWQAFLACMSTGIDPKHPDLPEILKVLEGSVTRQDLVRGFGYQYDTRELRAHEYGVPTLRKRLYGVFRCDGKPITWPEPTHGPGKLPYRTIAECIDWSLKCPSIFLRGKAAKLARCKRPLAVTTEKRVAVGIDRFVLKSQRPFLVNLTHQGAVRVEPADLPCNTITGANRGEKAVVSSTVVNTCNGKSDTAPSRTRPVDTPLPPVTGTQKFGMTMPIMIQTGHYSTNSHMSKGADEPMRTQTTAPSHAVVEASVAPFITEHANASNQRNMAADEPLRTTCAQVKGGHFALVESKHILVNTTGHPGSEVSQPAPTVCTGGHQALITGTLVHTAHGEQCSQGKKRRGKGAHAIDESMPTLTTSPDLAFAAGTLVQVGYGEREGQAPRAMDVGQPVGTIVAGGGKHALAAASMVKLRGDNIGGVVDGPMHTASAGGTHHGLMMAHMTKFNTGSVGSDLDAPCPTVTAGNHSPDTRGGAASTHGIVAAYLAQHNGGFNTVVGRAADEPISTVTNSGSQQQLVEAHIEAVLSTEHVKGALRVARFLRRHGVVFDGKYATVAGCVIVDIGMRMLTPRELFLAQGFPPSFVIDEAVFINEDGTARTRKLTKEEQIRMCGNSVCPGVAEAIVRANLPELCPTKNGPSRTTQRDTRQVARV